MSTSMSGSAAPIVTETGSARTPPQGAGEQEHGAVDRPRRPSSSPLCVLVIGSRTLLGAMAPSAPAHGMRYEQIEAEADASIAPALDALEGTHVDASVVLDPPRYGAEALRRLPGATLGVLTERPPEDEASPVSLGLDRLVSFDPALTGERVGGTEVWRSIEPPVSDRFFAEVRSLHHAPRAMTVGRSTEHREAILMPVKHHHDLLQVLDGVSGEELAQLLAEYDVAIYVPRRWGPGFAQQAAMHLAAGQLLLGGPLAPAHGLERDIDYLGLDSADGLVWALDRLARFPEMYQRLRVRGRLKAEQFRASRLFARIAHDLLADVVAFGSEPQRSVG